MGLTHDKTPDMLHCFHWQLKWISVTRSGSKFTGHTSEQQTEKTLDTNRDVALSVADYDQADVRNELFFAEEFDNSSSGASCTKPSYDQHGSEKSVQRFSRKICDLLIG